MTSHFRQVAASGRTEVWSQSVSSMRYRYRKVRISTGSSSNFMSLCENNLTGELRTLLHNIRFPLDALNFHYLVNSLSDLFHTFPNPKRATETPTANYTPWQHPA